LFPRLCGIFNLSLKAILKINPNWAVRNLSANLANNELEISDVAFDGFVLKYLSSKHHYLAKKVSAGADKNF